MEGTNPQENKPIEQESAPSGFGSLMLFNRNSHFAYIYRKTEKLVTAVYMITNFIKDNEPLKWKIRENALELMALNIAFNTVSLSERRDLIREYQALSLEIVSLSGIARHAGLISEMNYQILSREFSNLVSVIEKDENKKSNEETVILDPGFFEVPNPESQTTLGSLPIASEAKGEPSRTSNDSVLYKGHEASFRAPSREERKTDYLSLKDAREKASKSGDGKDSRQAVIIKLLSKKSGLNVNDFVDSIKGVSVKTIQRELLAMVASGVLKKEGERRWSTYSLANK
jgi:hypothetical protein